MDYLATLLHREFANRAEDVRLIIDFRAGPQIDSMVFKDGKFIILELKNVNGDITADLSPGGTWKRTDKGSQFKFDRNPFSQVRRQRDWVTSFFWERILGKIEPLNLRNRYSESFWRHFDGWVVMKSGANIKFVGRKPSEFPWFAALPIDDVARALRFERGEESLFLEEHFIQFIEHIKAEERPWDESIRGAKLVEEEGPHTIRIPHLNFLLTSKKPEHVFKGLRYILELGLGDYAQEVYIASTNPDKSVRKMALDILSAWDVPDLGRVLARYLDDESSELRNQALDMLGKGSYPEAIPILAELIRGKEVNEVVAALRALGATEHPEARQVVFEYAKKQPIDEVKDSEIPWYTIIRVLGQLTFEDSVPWLLEFLTHVESLAPIGEDNRIDMLREEIIHSLGQIGDSRALEPLLKRAEIYENGWIIEPIKALGHMGDPKAVEHLLPFLDSKKDWMKEEAVRALCRIVSKDVYEPLARFYFEELEEHGLSAILQDIEDALVSMDISRTERLVLEHVEKKELPEDEIGWRMMYFLYRVASEACIDTVFHYLKNKTFYLQAAETLWRVESVEVENRMMNLLKSEDSYERASAVWYMSRKWGKELLNELKKFENDPDRVVRRAVADLYSFMHNATGRSSLLRMVNDEDSVVQYTVYTAHIGESIHHLPSSWVCFGDEAHKARYVLLTEGGILAWLKEEEEYPQDEQETEDQAGTLLFIEAGNIERAATVELTEEDFGLYVVAGTDAERWEYLIKPEDPFGIIVPDRELSTFLHELIGVTHRDLGPPSLDMEEAEAVKRLWGLSKTD
jgi:HEAT repeat protein